MGFSSGKGGGSHVNPFNSLTLFTEFAKSIGLDITQNLPEPGKPFGTLSVNDNPFEQLLKTIEGEFANRPTNEFLGNVTAPFGDVRTNLEDLQGRARALPGEVSQDIRSGVLGRTDKASIAAVEASRRAGGLVGDAPARAANAAAIAAAEQNAAIGGIEASAKLGGLQTEAGIATSLGQLASAESAANQFGAKVTESRFAQELGTRVGARENFLNLVASLGGASTSGIGGATSGGGSTNFGGSIK